MSDLSGASADAETGSREPSPASGLGPSGFDPARIWRFDEIAKLEADKGFLPLEYWPRLVIIESPYAGDIELNVAYARAAMRDSLNRGEYPIASHLLYTQPGILRDEVPEERQWGIDAGLAWRNVAHAAVFYTDRGWSSGMLEAKRVYEREGFDFTARTLASGIEARSDATGTGAAEGESPVPKADAK